jgi:PAS domain S-box-containing protein
VDTLFFGESTNGSARLPANKTEIRFPNLKGWYEISSSATKLEQDRAATIYLIRDVTERKQASLDLSRQKEYYETLVRNSPFAIVTLSLEQRIVASNPAFERIFGYTQQEVIGHEIDQLISPPDLVSESQSLSDSVLSGQVVHKVTRRMRKDGSLVDVEVYGIPVVLWGKQIGLLALYHDVSQLVEPEAAAPPMQLYEDYTTGEDQLMEVEEQLEEIPAEDPLMEVEQQRVEDIADSGDVEEELEQDAIAKLSAKSVTEIEGIGPAYSDRLAAIGITTIDQYLAAAAHRDGRKHVSEETGISSKLILDWANRADLMRVPGIGEEFSDLLEQAGVDSVNELKFRNPQNLYTALIEINQEKNLVRRLPSQADLESWIESAKQLPAMLTY